MSMGRSLMGDSAAHPALVDMGSTKESSLSSEGTGCGPGLGIHLLSKDVWRPQSGTHPEERGWKDPSLFPFLFLLLCLPVLIHKSRPDPMSLNRQEELWTECALPPALPSGPNTPSTPALTPPLRSSEAPTLNPFQSFPPFGPPQSKLSFPEPSIN